MRRPRWPPGLPAPSERDGDGTDLAQQVEADVTKSSQAEAETVSSGHAAAGTLPSAMTLARATASAGGGDAIAAAMMRSLARQPPPLGLTIPCPPLIGAALRLLGAVLGNVASALDELQMLGIDTGPAVAAVMTDKARLDLASQELPGSAMRGNPSGCATVAR